MKLNELIVFPIISASQRISWHGQRQNPQQQVLLQQQQIAQNQNFQQQSQQSQQQRVPSSMPSNQQFQQQQSGRHVTSQQNLQQASPQSLIQQQIHSPQQQTQSPQPHLQSPHQQMQQFHPQVRQQQSQHLQSVQQLSHASVIAGASPSSSTVTTSNFASKTPSSTVIASSYNNSTEFANSFPGRPMQASRIASGNYSENVVNSSFQQHNFLPSTSQNSSHAIHQNVGSSSKSQPFTNAEGGSSSGNFGYPPNVIQNSSVGMGQSPLIASMPTPTPTPSPTPTQSPTRFMQRASVITSESNQPNGMYAMPVVDKFLIGDDINLNMADQLNSPGLLQSNMVGQLPSIIDPSTNQPIQIPPQLQSQIESHLQLNGPNHLTSEMDSHEMYPADMLESTISSSNLLNDVSSNMPIISGDLSMTPPLSSSVPQLDSVPHILGKHMGDIWVSFGIEL